MTGLRHRSAPFIMTVFDIWNRSACLTGSSAISQNTPKNLGILTRGKVGIGGTRLAKFSAARPGSSPAPFSCSREKHEKLWCLSRNIDAQASTETLRMSSATSTINPAVAGRVTDPEDPQRSNKLRFHDYFLSFVPLLGSVVSVFCFIRLDYARLDLRFAILALVTICFGSRLGIEFSKHRIQITVSDSFIFLTLLLYGVETAVLLAAAEAFCSSFRFSKLWRIRLFNASLLAISTFVTGMVVRSIFGPVVELGRGQLSGNFVTAVCLIALIQFLVNSSIPALRQSLKLDLPFVQLWRQHYLWTSITYLAGGSAAGITAKLINGNGFYAFMAIVPVVSVIYFTYQTYRKQ